MEDALFNPRRKKLRLIVTKNARAKLAKAIEVSGITPEVLEPRDLNEFIDKNSIHQGALLEVRPLEWGSLMDVVMQSKSKLPNLVLLDRVTDPHNVGAILRSAEVFGASAVVGTRHHSAPETGALAKAASGALERQPYIRVKNLSDLILELKKIGFVALGLDATGSSDISDAAKLYSDRPIALILGAEGPAKIANEGSSRRFRLKLSRYHHLAHSMCLMPRLLVCILLQQYENLLLSRSVMFLVIFVLRIL